ETRFARRMTTTARRIGMTRTTFRNASGLPDRRQRTTARDMATLGLRMQRDFPRYYKFFGTKRFSYRGRRFGNNNKLLGRVVGVDGIKTGYTRASGFNLTSSVRRGKKRIVAVVMGGRTGRARNRYMSSLIKRMFAKKRLTNSTRIASTAGRPPGYKPVRAATTRLAVVKNPPLPRKKPVFQKPVVLAKKQQDRLIPAKPVQAAVSTFKTASIIDDEGQAEIAPFKNDDGSFAVVSSTKSDLIIPQTNPPQIVPVKSVTKVAEAPLPKASNQPKKTSNHSDTWNIQIGAFPSKKGATGRLANATEKARKNLRGKVAFTIEVNKNGSKFYRARFAGFNRKTAARACRTLSRKGFGCFALAPRS
ncbi:D-alanyl-D-alanine carboxypeptidase, partial [hydrothermal vent metagenome]